MSRKQNLDKFQELMFRDLDEITGMTEAERAQLLRYRFAFSILLENPSTQDTLLRDSLISEFGISQSQAYRDISNMKVILPNIRNAGKEWIRYIVNEELKKAIADAVAQGKLKERILAISALAKYNKLDQDEAEELPWHEIIPIGIEPVNDPTVLDALPVTQDEIDALYKKYSNDIEIAQYEDVKDDKKEDIL